MDSLGTDFPKDTQPIRNTPVLC